MYTVRELSEILHLSYDEALAWCRDGRIAARRRTQYSPYRIPGISIRRFLDVSHNKEPQ